MPWHVHIESFNLESSNLDEYANRRSTTVVKFIIQDSWIKREFVVLSGSMQRDIAKLTCVNFSIRSSLLVLA